MIRALACVIAAGALAAPVGAQTPTLSRTDSLLAAGHYDEARQVLEQWKRRYPSGTPMTDSTRARSIMLEARLSPDIDKAQELYVSIALTHPRSRYAPEALLRLGQSHAAAGNHRRARSYLERLVDDYPRSELRPAGMLWLARSQLALGSATQACSTINSALKLAGLSSQESQLLKLEEPAACSTQRRADTPEPQSIQRTADTRTTDRTPPRSSGNAPTNNNAAANAATRFGVQTGAFRDLDGARELVARLQRAGFKPRIVTVPGSPLHRVRVGSFTTREAAVRELSRIKAKGFSAMIVGDVVRERATR